MSKNISSLSHRKGLTDNLFESYTKAAVATGTPGAEDLKEISKNVMLGEAIVYGASSFYDFLKPENKGKKAYVCNGTACKVACTQTKVEAALEGAFGKEAVGEICCLGRCHEGGSFQYDGKNYSGDAATVINDIIAGKATDKADDKYQVGGVGELLQSSDFGGLVVYREQLKKMLASTPELLLEEINISRLRGRGGAGFPAGIKWGVTKNANGDEKYVVCNADEGDPGAYTDKYLMEQQPERVLLGMMLAGYIAGAASGVLYIRKEYPDSVAIIAETIEKLIDEKMVGTDIFGSGFNFDFKIIEGAGAYICGEETALLASIEGCRPEVRVRPPFPAVEGLYRKPTVLNNVETFALAQSILDIGGDAFSKIGTEKSTGTKLVSLDSFFNTPGVYEVPMGTPLMTVIETLGGGFTESVKALQVGGPLGGAVPASHFDKLTIDFESFQQGGFLLGHAGMVSIPETFSIAEYIEHLFEFTAIESCGKCFPCRIGSIRGQEMFAKAQAGEYMIDRELLDDLLETLEIGSLCALGGGVPLPIKNLLSHFEDELSSFMKNGVAK
jgi:NADH-quinone oxidoreductase subunit F